MNKTAVDWLIEQVKDDQLKNAKTDIDWLNVFQQAKEIEQSHLIEHYTAGVKDCNTHWKTIISNLLKHD